MALSQGAITAIVVCTCVIVALVVAVGTYLYTRRRKANSSYPPRTSADTESFLKKEEKATPPLPFQRVPHVNDESGRTLLQPEETEFNPYSHSPTHSEYHSIQPLRHQASPYANPQELPNNNTWIPTRTRPTSLQLGEQRLSNSQERGRIRHSARLSDPFSSQPSTAHLSDSAYLPSPSPSQAAFPTHHRTYSSQSPNGSRSPRPPLSPLLIPGTPSTAKPKEIKPERQEEQRQDSETSSMQTAATTDSAYSQPSAWHHDQNDLADESFMVDLTAPPMPPLPQFQPQALLADDNRAYSAYPAYEESPHTPSPVLPTTVPAFLENHRHPEVLVPRSEEYDADLQRAPTKVISKLLKQRMSRVVNGEELEQGAGLERNVSKIERADSIRSAGDDGAEDEPETSQGRRRPKVNRLDIQKRAYLNRVPTQTDLPKSSHGDVQEFSASFSGF
ncbi:hypothetical protein DL96DRAFT_1600570 [Flagelloscypha sp. PMI_526]|nr:hypothetical protein DL96DRAFT_1600570 [Flagelloscypha sp. PMI_526]